MDKLGQELIEAINKVFGTKIPITEENAKTVSQLFGDIAQESDYGYCPDCDERMPDPPDHSWRD